MAVAEAELTDWRRRVSELYAAVRAHDDPERARALWRSGRDALFRCSSAKPARRQAICCVETGMPYWPYDPALRFKLPLLPAPGPEQRLAPAGEDGSARLRLLGQVELPAPLSATIGVWWLQQYAGGLFLPLRDGTAGQASYGGGHYNLDTAKGADLGGTASTLIIDLNFLYHPSCRYSSRWQCPLAPPSNTITAPVHGKRTPQLHSHLSPGASARRLVQENGGADRTRLARFSLPAGKATMVRADEDAGHVGGETIMSRPGRAPAVPGWRCPGW